MPQLGTIFEVGEIQQSGGTSSATGTEFLVGAAAYGPEEPTKVRSLSEVVRYYGERETENAKLYDAANAFFALGGQTLWINRIHGAGAPAAALLELETAAKTKVLVVTAKYKGKYGEKYKVTIAENGSSETRYEVTAPNGEVVERSPYYLKASQMLKYGEEHTPYVTWSKGSNYASGESELVKKLAATALATGANPTNNETTTIESIEGFPKSLGPGQIVVAATEALKEKVHQAMHEAAQKNNRFALCDIEGSETPGTTVASLIANKKAGVTGAVLLGYGAYFSSAVKVAGLTLGTERTIPASAIVAGLFAVVAQTGTDNIAPAGPRYPLAPFVLSFVNTYNEAQQNELNTAGINVMAERQNRLCLFGDVTACSQEKDLIFYQYSSARERMRLVYEGERTMENFQFGEPIDGRHQKRSKMQGELQGVLKGQWEKNALYGESAPQAGEVKVGEPVNTPATEQAGELNAELLVRLSPGVWSLRGILISVPITETV
jgi:hypothetical protein